MKYLKLLCFFLLFNSSKSPLFAQAPNANFSAAVVKGCGELKVDFIDQSTGNPTAYSWDFGNGTPISTLKNPTAFYAGPGTYTVKLTVTNASGTDTETKTGYITVFKLPASQFTADKLKGCSPLSVQFTEQSLPGDAPITTWMWDFGDGGSSASKDPTHTYTAGTYTVSLFVTDANNCTGKKIEPAYIKVDPSPKATFSASPTQSCKPPLTVNFASTSVGTNLTYLWRFGDGTTSTSASPAHTYTATGNYDVTLIVTSAGGCKDSIKVQKYISVGGFKAGIKATPAMGCKPLNVAFADSSLPAPVSSWKWDFGDGSTVSLLQNPNHTYSNPGSYTVKLVATNNAGCKDSITKNITVHEPPVAKFTADDTTACKVPFTVNFTDNTNGAVSWKWDFGDSTIASTVKNPAHTYQNSGIYTVKLIVTDANGCTDTLIKKDFIKIILPEVDFVADTLKGCAPLKVDFNDLSKSNEPITSWLWNFGDPNSGTANTSTLQNPTHIYNDTGRYTVSLTIVNNEGCTKQLIKTTYIRVGLKPIPKFSTTDTLGCHPYTAQFTDSSSKWTDEWKWSFGDGGGSMVKNPLYIYNKDTGIFNVMLVVGHNGCYDTLIKFNYVRVLPPKPLFEATPLIHCTYPAVVTFTDKSKGADTWLWHFGDGTTDTVKNPAPHTYVNPGFYNVKLVVTNKNGCKDSLIIPEYIKISDMKADFKNELTACRPDTISFTDMSYVNTSITNWYWDFGDGSSPLTGAGIIPPGTHGGLTFGAFSAPKHVYTVAGNYTVKLVVTDILGCTDTMAKIAVTIYELPVPQFSASPLTGCVPLDVTFTDGSTATAPATLSSWAWNFGNGITSNTQVPPVVRYGTRGAYSVSLKVTDSNGCSSIITKPGYIEPTKPYPDFIFKTTACNGESVIFNDVTTTVGAKGGITKWEWDFGDGTQGPNTKYPAHTYTVTATTTFTVTLKVTDGNGCDSTIKKTIKISKPKVDFEPASKVSDCPPHSTSFDYTGGAASDIVTWAWNFGNGATSTQSPPVSATYASPGVYNVSLTVTNTDGCSETLKRDSLIRVGGPSGTFTFTPNTSTGCPPFKVTFTATAKNTEFYTWVFGDGETGTGNPITHEYTSGGVFKPVLIIVDSLDKSIGDTVRCQVTVTVPDVITVTGPVLDFSASSTVLCASQPVKFTNLTTPLTGVSSWLWDFGDGGTSTDKDPTYQYTKAGIYDITLTVTAGNCTFTSKKKAYIQLFVPPNITFTSSIAAGCVPLDVQFNIDTAKVNPPITSWVWNWGDGGDTSTIKNPVHTYVNPGVYNASAEVKFKNGCSGNYIVKTITGYDKPTAAFAMDPLIKDDKVTSIRFENQSIDASTYLWNFGDGKTGTQKDPVHVYGNEGQYVIKLTAYNQYGCWDTVSRRYNIFFKVVIPNIFTPNGDGKNDFFQLQIPTDIDHFRLKIYNRWGLEMYESDDYRNDWNGTDKQNNPLSDGTYYYVLTYYDKYAWYGWVQILRNNK